jgi:hypothetical protein
MTKYGDYKSTPVLNLLRNLESYCYSQPYIDNDDNKDNSVKSNLNILMRIINAFLPNLPITHAGGDYKNNCYLHHLTSGCYIQLVNAHLVPVDLLYPMRLS